MGLVVRVEHLDDMTSSDALVGAPGWMRSMVQIIWPLLPMEIRDLDTSNDAAARDWARSG